jgi:hypothetical protein
MLQKHSFHSKCHINDWCWWVKCAVLFWSFCCAVLLVLHSSSSSSSQDRARHVISQGTEVNGPMPQWPWCTLWLALCPQKFLSHFPFAKAMPNWNGLENGCPTIFLRRQALPVHITSSMSSSTASLHYMPAVCMCVYSVYRNVTVLLLLLHLLASLIYLKPSIHNTMFTSTQVYFSSVLLKHPTQIWYPLCSLPVSTVVGLDYRCLFLG